MRYVKFLRDTNLQREGGDFKEGAVVALKPASAARWVKRNAAEYVNAFVQLADVTTLSDETPQFVEVPIGDVLASAPDVAGADSGDSGERPEPVAGASAPRRRGRPARNSGQ